MPLELPFKRGEAHRNETHLIPRVLNVATGGRSHVEIFGTDYLTPDGICIRDYVLVLDIAEAHVAAIEGMNHLNGRSFNVGTGRGFSSRGHRGIASDHRPKDNCEVGSSASW